MPTAPKRLNPPHFEPSAERQRQKWSTQDRWRGSASSRGYGSKWRAAREGHLRNSPLCVCCVANGRVTAARIVDHSIPHQGDMKLFWRSELWQSLCDDCNQRIKQPLELRYKAGLLPASDLNLARKLPEFFPE